MNSEQTDSAGLKRSWNVLLIAGRLLTAIVAYIGAYSAIVTVVVPLSMPTTTIPSYGAMERLGAGKLGSSVEKALNVGFRPLHWIDRRLRPEVWSE